MYTVNQHHCSYHLTFQPVIINAGYETYVVISSVYSEVKWTLYLGPEGETGTKSSESGTCQVRFSFWPLDASAHRLKASPSALNCHF